MKIHIEQKALEYINGKSYDKVITLDVRERPGGVCSGCGGLYYPSVKTESPNFPEDYKRIKVENITVYYRSDLCDIFSGITIKVDKLFFTIKSLVAVGEK